MTTREMAGAFLRRCLSCQHGSPSGRCLYAGGAGFRQWTPQNLSYAARRAHQDLPVAWRRVTLALIEPCPGYQAQGSSTG